MIDTAYHASLRFIPNCSALTHHCELWSWVGWPALVYTGICSYTRQFLGCCHPIYVFIFHRKLMDSIPFILDFYMLTVPNNHTESGKRTFRCSTPSDWNVLQKFCDLISLNAFKSILKDLETESLGCLCLN